jgi:hypothetical protein
MLFLTSSPLLQRSSLLRYVMCLRFWAIYNQLAHHSFLFAFLQVLILKTCRLYNVFRSGANHGIYDQFMAQSAMANKGCLVNFLRGAGTQMALWFYAMVCLLRLPAATAATIHRQRFFDLNLNDSVRAAVHDIKDDKFWKCVYLLVRAVFPALRLLCYCNKSKPAMDEMFFLSHRTTLALEKLEEFLNDRNLSGPLRSDSNLTKEGNTLFWGTKRT